MNKKLMEKDRYFVSALAKGLDILQVIANAGRPLPLSEVSASLGINKSTTMRFCHTLIKLGFLQRNREKLYYPTPRILSLGYKSIQGMTWLDVTEFYLESLSMQVEEAVGLLILDENEVLYLKRVVKKEHLLPYDVQIGAKFPVYCTSVGKALLAFRPREDAINILKNIEFKPLTHRTITSFEEYLNELDFVNQNGYAISDEELSVGLRSIAVPVRNPEGTAIFAININVPTKRHDIKYLSKVIAPHALRSAEDIGKALEDIGWDFII